MPGLRTAVLILALCVLAIANAWIWNSYCLNGVSWQLGSILDDLVQFEEVAFVQQEKFVFMLAM